MITIGRAAKRCGMSVDTLRYYEREGLLRGLRRTSSQYRLYDDLDIARLRFIGRAKELGFSLSEIREMLDLNDGSGTRSSVRAIARHRVAEITQRIEELGRIRASLQELVNQCDGHGPLAGCPIIDSLLNVSENGRMAPADGSQQKISAA